MEAADATPARVLYTIIRPIDASARQFNLRLEPEDLADMAASTAAVEAWARMHSCTVTANFVLDAASSIQAFHHHIQGYFPLSTGHMFVGYAPGDESPFEFNVTFMPASTAAQTQPASIAGQMAS